jgi:protein PET100
MFPIGIMYYFGTNLDSKFSVPGFWPTREQSHKMPTEKGELEKELDRLKAIRLAIRDKRLRQDGLLEDGQERTIDGSSGSLMEKLNKSWAGREG